MAKRKRAFTKRTYERWLKQGRGTGEGINYKPWLRIQDVASFGLCHRIMSVWTTFRETYLMSNLERDWFFCFDWMLRVVDLQEQYPLRLEDTLDIAAECGVDHPREYRTKERHPIVLTTDLLLTIVTKNGTTVLQPVTVKYANQLANLRTLEKFEIENRYYRRRGLELMIATEQDLRFEMARNIELIRGRVNISDRVPLAPGQILTIAETLTDRVLNEDLPLRVITSESDRQYNLAKGSCLAIVYHLLANRYWKINMLERINPGYRLILRGQSIEKLAARSVAKEV